MVLSGLVVDSFGYISEAIPSLFNRGFPRILQSYYTIVPMIVSIILPTPPRVVLLRIMKSRETRTIGFLEPHAPDLRLIIPTKRIKVQSKSVFSTSAFWQDLRSPAGHSQCPIRPPAICVLLAMPQ